MAKNNSSSNKLNIDKLINAYESIYQNQVRDFNALSTIHLSENDHTNILCEILNMKVMDKKPFMKSFVNDVLGIDFNFNCDNLIAKTQVSAIGTVTKVTKNGKKDSGFIDLLLEDKKQNLYIIIENKVCGAGDGSDQLARYYFTYKNDDINLQKYYKDNKDKWKSRQANVKNSVYLVYLTDYTYEDKQDAKEKCPNEKSIEPQLLENLKDIYRHISYEEHIYSWLKEQVLPMIPYGKNGDAHNSIILYLRELENILGANNSKNEWYLENTEIKNIIDPILNSSALNTDQYKKLDKAYKELKQKTGETIEESSPALNDLLSCVLCYRDNVFGKYAPEGWTVYCAANYITFYPTRWLAKYGGSKTSCVHFAIDNWCKDTPMIMLKIHGSACKQHIVKDESTFEKRVSNLNDFGLFSNTNEYNNNYDDTIDKFRKSNHYYFNLEINLKQMEPSLEWKRDSQASDNFFSKFIENDTIKKLVKYIDDNFK